MFSGTAVLAVRWYKNQYQDEDKAETESEKQCEKLNYTLLLFLTIIIIASSSE